MNTKIITTLVAVLALLLGGVGGYVIGNDNDAKTEPIAEHTDDLAGVSSASPVPLNASADKSLEGKQVTVETITASDFSKYLGLNMTVTGRLERLVQTNGEDYILRATDGQKFLFLNLDKYKGNVQGFIKQNVKVKGRVDTVQNTQKATTLGIVVTDITPDR